MKISELARLSLKTVDQNQSILLVSINLHQLTLFVMEPRIDSDFQRMNGSTKTSTMKSDLRDTMLGGDQAQGST